MYGSCSSSMTDRVVQITTERDDLDAEIKALRMVIAQLIDAKSHDGDHGDRMARVRELQALLKDLEQQLMPLRMRCCSEATVFAALSHLFL